MCSVVSCVSASSDFYFYSPGRKEHLARTSICCRSREGGSVCRVPHQEQRLGVWQGGPGRAWVVASVVMISYDTDTYAPPGSCVGHQRPEGVHLRRS